MDKSIFERDSVLQQALFKEISLKDCKDNFSKLSKQVAEELFDIEKNLFELDCSKSNNPSKQTICLALRDRLANCDLQLREVHIMYQVTGLFMLTLTGFPIG